MKKSSRKLVLTKSFIKSFKKFTDNNQSLKTTIEAAIYELEKNPFSPSLKTHKLSGNLYGLLACSCGYDCRIIFLIARGKGKREEVILLVGIGTHDDVY